MDEIRGVTVIFISEDVAMGAFAGIAENQFENRVGIYPLKN